MNLDFTVHAGTQEQRMRAALEADHAENAARTQVAPAPVPAPARAASGARARLSQRLGLSDPKASDHEIFAALDGTLAVAKAKRTQVNTTDALYEATWGSPTATAAPVGTPADAALYDLVFGADKAGV